MSKVHSIPKLTHVALDQHVHARIPPHPPVEQASACDRGFSLGDTHRNPAPRVIPNPASAGEAPAFLPITTHHHIDFVPAQSLTAFTNRASRNRRLIL